MITLPKDDLKKQEILQKIINKFQEDTEYSEQEVNDVINSFEVEDYALIRRELVNFGYLAKNSYQGVYWVLTKNKTAEKLKKIRQNQERINKAGHY
ncbi:MAG: DUF2087 domain-containing protein [Candidatus Woesearchaeota archaeon]